VQYLIGFIPFLELHVEKVDLISVLYRLLQYLESGKIRLAQFKT